MLFKPHTVILLPPTQTRDPATKSVFVPTFTTGETIACQITPEKSTVAFEALGVVITNPHTLLCEVADAPRFAVGVRVQWNAPSGIVRKFRVAGGLQTYEMGTAADCAVVFLEEQPRLENKAV